MFMNFTLSNKEFYRRHNKELERYLIEEDSLHLINIKSKNKITEKKSYKHYIDLESNGINDLLTIDKKFGVVILTDIVEVTEDLFELFKIVSKLLIPNGKLVISSINNKWAFILKMFEYFNIKESNKKFSSIHNKRIKNIASGVGLEFIKSNSRQLFPFKFIHIGSIINKFLEATFYAFNLGIKTYIILRKETKEKSNLSKTIIVPAKNEEGNLQILFDRIPDKSNSEVIFSLGKSKDNTLEVANQIKLDNPETNIKILEQSKNGKANAVWEALDQSTGEVIAILDADISVEPETLTDFFEIIENNHADFVNGTRLIYEMEKDAMRYLNKKGNIIFQFFIGLIIKQKLTDSLCGTKVFKKDFINKIKWWQTSFNLKDPFGDFDLIFTAAFTGQKIIEYPVHYKSRIYGSTQIKRFRDGLKLFSYMAKSYFVFNTSK